MERREPQGPPPLIDPTKWCALKDLNPEPSGSKPAALSIELRTLIWHGEQDSNLPYWSQSPVYCPYTTPVVLISLTSL